MNEDVTHFMFQQWQAVLKNYLNFTVIIIFFVFCYTFNISKNDSNQKLYILIRYKFYFCEKISKIGFEFLVKFVLYLTNKLQN
jgi:hypothetical protein